MSKKIKFDSNNFNQHTEEGMKLLERSIKEVGVIEAIATDAEGEIITGNARKETFDKLGYKPKFISLEKDEYPVIETNLKGEKRTKASIFANTVSLKNVDLDVVAIQEAGVDLEEVGLTAIVEDAEGESIEIGIEDLEESKELTPEKEYIIVMFDSKEQYREFLIEHNVPFQKSPNFISDNRTEINYKRVFDYEDLHTIKQQSDQSKN